VDGLVKAGYKYTVDVDLKSYFDTIPHDLLIKELRKYVADNQVIGLVEKLLQAEIVDEKDRWIPQTGVPQGAIIGPSGIIVGRDPIHRSKTARLF
jgi:RNA-directed DNA polymerase